MMMLEESRVKMRELRKWCHEKKVQRTIKKNRRFLIDFDEEYYLEENPDVKAAGVNPLYHYVTVGMAEGRLPNKDSEKNEGYEKWLMLPRKKGLKRFINDWKNIYIILKSGKFDGGWYLSRYRDVNEYLTQKRIWKYRYKKNSLLRLAAQAFTNACVHYVTKGVYLGYSPNAFFDTVYYMDHNPDLCKNPELNPFVHYLRFGEKEGRKCGEKGTSLTSIWMNEFGTKKENIGVSIVTPSKTYIPVKESEYIQYNIEVIESTKDYKKGMNSCHNQVIWFLEETCELGTFIDILSCRKYFVDEAVFAVCCQGETEFQVSSYLEKIEGCFPVYILFESKTTLLRKRQFLSEKEASHSFPAFVYNIINGAKIVYTNVIKKPLKKVEPEEIFEADKNMVTGFGMNISMALNLYHTIRNQALARDISENEWRAKQWLENITDTVRIPRILISIYAFSYGGGEIMPIRLANALWEKGCHVGVHVYNAADDNQEVRALLYPSIPVIYADDIGKMTTLVAKLGYNVIHTHHQACQSFIDLVLAKNQELKKSICHVATSHGMYENFDVETLETILLRKGLAGRVSCWTYVADKNLEPFKRLHLYDKERFVKIPNGMKKPDIYPFDLSEYGITKDDFVVTIVSRALVQKGWLHAIHAVEMLHESHPEIHLLLVGNGEVYDKYAEKLGNEYIHFLGFRKNPCDIFSVSQLCLLPSYYESESAPLCLIEAMMCGIPSVATDIGDVRDMLTDGDEVAGKIISLHNNCVDEDELANTIRELVEDRKAYASAVEAAKRKCNVYRIDTIADRYFAVYCQVIEKFLKQTKSINEIIEREKQTDSMLWNAKRGMSTPKVSVIVPNYNHSQFLRQRLDSIYGQSYQNLEVLLMDDCSTDNSREILKEYAEKYPDKTKLLFNEENSGGVFYQWAKGIRHASGELCWIAESDDYCEKNFLETLVPEFQNKDIRLAYAKYVFVNGKGKQDTSGFWNYMSQVNPNKWHHSYRGTSLCEIHEGLGIINTIPNASGAIFRNPGEMSLFSDPDWYQMKICGDWIFYLHLIKDGSIAYRSDTTSYFRFHSDNSSAKTYAQRVYYKEHGQVAECLWDLYHPDDRIMLRQKEKVWNFFQQNVGSDREKFEQWYGFNHEDKIKTASLRGEESIRETSRFIKESEDDILKKVLLLNPINGVKNIKPENTLEYNMELMGYNTGNQVFVEAVRQQVNSSVEVWTHPLKVKELNEDEDDYVGALPCSNFIIEGTVRHVSCTLMNLYNNTNFPIVPIGLGAQSSQNANTPRKLVQRLEQPVITWLKMASERAVSIGIRGEFTAECLDLLGIHNYRIIGCPSLYQYLDGIFPRLQEPSAEKTLFSTTAKSEKEAAMLQMAIRNDSKWVLQMETEYPELLYHDEIPNKKTVEKYFPGLQVKPVEFRAFMKKNAHMFFNFDEWNTYLQKENFTFAYGSRFHGNMMALRNKIPTLWITHDSRTSELVNTLHLPHISIEKAIKFHSPEELIPYCDYSEFYKAWPKMVKEYVSFLEENHLDHKFDI